MMWRSSNTSELYFDDVRVPKDNILGKPGDGFHQMLATLDQRKHPVLVDELLIDGTNDLEVDLGVGAAERQPRDSGRGVDSDR